MHACMHAAIQLVVRWFSQLVGFGLARQEPFSFLSTFDVVPPESTSENSDHRDENYEGRHHGNDSDHFNLLGGVRHEDQFLGIFQFLADCILRNDMKRNEMK
jgi:hypothetical protein